MEYKGLILDKFQEDAIHSLEANRSVVVSAPTGSGKTLIADYIINRDLKEGVKVIYTAPIKALSNQKYKEFSTDYGASNVGLLTGDIVKNPSAPILIMTTEVYRNMAMTREPMLDSVSYVIFDEIHYINDIERGYVWEESVIFSQPHMRFLCLSATIPNAEEFAAWIKAIKKHDVDVIVSEKRNVPLHRAFFDADLGITTLEKIRDLQNVPDYNHVMGRSKRRRPIFKAPSHVALVRLIMGKLPCFFFTFSRKGCQDNAMDLAKERLFKHDPEINTYIRRKLEGAPEEINNLKSTKVLRRTLPFGIGFHHAGLIPIMKELVEELFSLGKIRVLYTTETFAVGINMPAKTVCFNSLRKFDGINFRFLNSKEYFQIAGRAGRRGIDKEGFAYAMIDRRDFDYDMLRGMTDKDVEPIHSQFKLSVNTVLNLIKQHTKEEIATVLCMNFHTFQKYGKAFGTRRKGVIFSTFDNIRRKLIKFGYVSSDDKLTWKGNFSSKIYADEIEFGEIFATDFYKNLNEFQILMVIACLCYESKQRTKFEKTFGSDFVNKLKRELKGNEFLGRVKRFRNMDKLTALIDPIYHGKTIFEIMENTNLLEGDLIRFFRQMLDRIGQVKEATDNEQLVHLLGNCRRIIEDSMQEIDII